MAFVFEGILTEGIAALSYLIGDDSDGTGAVIDPRTDVDVYLNLARKRKLSITHIFETHIHADFVSGARELAAQCGSARIYVSVEGGAEYGFDHIPIRGNDEFQFGRMVLKVKHTPGHTPEHVAYEIAEMGTGIPFAVFTGDSLFVSSAGRPDLLGKDADKLALQLYHTVFDYFGKLDDSVIIFPSHGHGSPCGADIGDRLESTIGYERKFNPYFALKDSDEFVQHALSTAPPEPAYYKRMKKVNAEGPEITLGLPRIPALCPKAFREAVERHEAVLVDTRHALAFGGGHVRGAMNIGATPMLTIWAGWLLDPDQPILLILEHDDDAEKVARLFVRSGYTRFAGYLAGGMSGWDKAGYPIVRLHQMSAQEVEASTENLQILDVRAPSEWKGGHVPGAKHMFVPEIRERSGELDKKKPVVTYCATGYRASIAASLLQQQGLADVRTIPGSWTAWTRSGFPISTDGETKAAH